MGSKDALEAKGELLKGKWVLITGASKGIGEAVAVKFAQQGAKIALVARSQDKLEAVRNDQSCIGCYCSLDLLPLYLVSLHITLLKASDQSCQCRPTGHCMC